MFEAKFDERGRVRLSGRLDAARADAAGEFFDGVRGTTTVDLSGLEYISSAGLGVLLATQKRLMAEGSSLKLTNANPHIHDIFRYSGFDRIFDITPASS